MQRNNLSVILRICGLTLLAVAIWFVARAGDAPPAPRGLDAPSTEFSAARADRVLARLLGPEIPHPLSSPENARVRARIQTEFSALGVKTNIFSGLGCDASPRHGYIACGTVHDVLADVQPGAGRAIVLLAHYDSVPAGPGAADDESGVATVLETVRALKARGFKSRHPILAVITDGEEAGLFGADAFLHDAKLRARVGAVVNVEARGNQGPSLLFQTSPGDGPLIDLYADNVPEYATSSLFAVIYRLLPNDTDLTLFLEHGFPSFNFAFSGNVAHYHTPLDRRANLSLATLQHQGDNMLGVASGLEQADFAQIKGSDDIYLTVLGRFLPRLPAGWALPLALLSFVLMIGAGRLSRERSFERRGWLMAFAMPPVLLLGSAATGWVLHRMAVLISGQPDPSFAFPDMLRVALTFGVCAIAFACSRMVELRRGGLAVWFWMSALAIVTAALVPGLSPYFLFPALIAALLLILASLTKWSGLTTQLALLAAALPALIIWLSLCSAGESVMGLALHPLFTIPAAFGVMALLPLAFANAIPRRIWIGLTGGTATLAVLLAIIAGLQPAHSAIAPQRLNITFIDDHISNKSSWAASAEAPLPVSLRKVAKFSNERVAVSPIPPRHAYIAESGIARYAPPSVIASIVPNTGGRQVVLTLQGSSVADEMFVVVPKTAALKSVAMQDRRFDVSRNSGETIIGCLSRDCRNKSLALEFASAKPANIVIGEQRFRLPPDSAQLVAARPREATASQSGDTTIVFKQLRLH